MLSILALTWFHYNYSLHLCLYLLIFIYNYIYDYNYIFEALARNIVEHKYYETRVELAIGFTNGRESEFNCSAEDGVVAC